jgi:hypothetical protein
MDSAAPLAPLSGGLLDDPVAPLPSIPSLQELCISYIASNLHLFPSLSALPYHLAELVVSHVPLPARIYN